MAVSLAVLLTLWELAVAVFQPRPSILPPPSRIAEQALIHAPQLAEHTWATLIVTLAGFTCSLAFSWAVAITVDFNDTLRRAITPLLVASQTIPIIAIAPLMILWFGFGLLPKILLVVLVTFFPMLLGLIEAFRATPSGKAELLASMGATRWQQFRYLRLPQALPAFFTSLRIAVTYAVVGAIFAEYAGSTAGLGVYMAVQKNAFRTDLVLAAVATTAAVSITLFALAVLAERLVAPWARRVRHDPAGRRR
ncbi:ABC transporter permease [Tessaracoccus sp. Z1128]